MHNSAPQTDIVLFGGEILTGNSGEIASAVYLKDGRVAAVGSNEEVMAAAGPDTPRHELKGATVIPGLIDTHPHLMHFSAFFGATVDITQTQNHGEIVDLIKTAASDKPKGDWVTTTPVGEPHYFLRRSWRNLEEGVLPDRHILDQAAPDHPVIIQAWAPAHPNVCAVNTRALEILGIDASTPDRVSNVWIEKDADGVPTGILSGSVTTYYNDDPYFRELIPKMPDLIQPDVIPAALAKSMAHYQSLGITTVFEAHDMDVPAIEAYKFLRSENLLGLRVKVAHSLEVNALPGDQPKSMDAIHGSLAHALADRNTDDDWLRIDGITTAAWGPAFCGRMGWQDGYMDAWGGTTQGARQISPDKMEMAIDWCAEHGLKLNLLTASPDEADEYIDWVSRAVKKHGIERTGWLIEHGYVMRPDQPKKFAELGFDITVSAGFAFGKGEMIEERFGSEALSWLNPLRNFLDSGMNVAASTDWGPTNPFEQMQLAVTHQMQPSGRLNNGPSQVITREEAFHMWTTGGAKVLEWDGIGTIAKGSYADLSIVDRNPITCDLESLASTQVLATFLDGRIVFDKDYFASTSAVEESIV